MGDFLWGIFEANPEVCFISVFFMWAGRGSAPSQSDPFWLISWVFVWFGWAFLQPKFPDA